MSKLKVINRFLEKIPIFQGCSEQELDVFSQYLKPISVSRNSTLFKKGDKGDSLIFIVSGSVNAVLDPSKKNATVKLENGSIIGEMSLIDGNPRSATAVVNEPTELLMISKDQFDTFCQENPLIGLKILKGITKIISVRLRESNARFVDFAPASYSSWLNLSVD